MQASRTGAITRNVSLLKTSIRRTVAVFMFGSLGALASCDVADAPAPRSAYSSAAVQPREVPRDEEVAPLRQTAFRPDLAVTASQLRDVLAGKLARRRSGEPSPIASESYAADRTWTSAVESTILSTLEGRWNASTGPGEGLRLCVLVTERNGATMSEPFEMCRSIQVSIDRASILLSDHNNHALVSIFDLEPIES